MIARDAPGFPEQPRITHIPDQVDDRLAEVELPPLAILSQVMDVAQAAAWDWDPHHPSVYFGQRIWGDATHALRFLTSKVAWTQAEPRHQPLALAPSGLVAVTVANANEATGTIGPPYPRTRAKKGRRTYEAAQQNQARLFDIWPKLRLPAINTWYLLIWADRSDRQFRAEISLPLGIHPDGHVSWWAERILLPQLDPLTVAPKYPNLIAPGTADSLPVDVSVERSAAWRTRGSSTRNV